MLYYAWRKISGPEVTLSSRTVESPTFTAPTQLVENAETVAFAFVDSTENDARLFVSSLTFTTSNWSTNQTITVTGRDDGGSSAQTADFTLNPSGANHDNAATVTVTRALPPTMAPNPTASISV